MFFAAAHPRQTRRPLSAISTPTPGSPHRVCQIKSSVFITFPHWSSHVSENRTPVQTPAAAANKSQEIGNAITQAGTSLTQNGNFSESPTPTSSPNGPLFPQPQSPGLILTPVRIESIEILDGGTTAAEVLVPTHAAPLPTQTPSFRRFGLIREKDVSEGREEIDTIQTTTTEPSGASEGSNKTSATDPQVDDAKTTTRTQPALSPISSTETEIAAFTLSPATTTETSTTSKPRTAASPLKQESGEDTSKRTSTAAGAVLTTATGGTEQSTSESTSPSPVYLPSNPQKELVFQFDDDFVRYLNQYYYSGGPVFNSIVGRGLH